MITSQSTGVIVNEGGTASLYVISPGATSYKWYKDDTLISCDSPVLHLKGIRCNNHQYYCTIIHDDVHVISGIMTCTTKDTDTRIMKSPESRSIIVGSDTTLVIISDGMSYQWYKNGVQIIGACYKRYTTEIYEKETTDYYYCIVDDIIHSDLCVITSIKYKKEPQIYEFPSYRYSIEGSYIQFTVGYNGHSVSKVEWYVNDEIVQSSESCSLIYGPISNDDFDKEFWCMISNQHGSCRSQSCQLLRRKVPSIKTHPKNIKVINGKKAMFESDSEDSDVSYQWYVNGVEIPEQESRYLIIDKCTLAHGGNIYHCMISNKFGSAITKQATLTVGREWRYLFGFLVFIILLCLILFIGFMIFHSMKYSSPSDTQSTKPRQ